VRHHQAFQEKKVSPYTSVDEIIGNHESF
jgi:hypothetical protein